MVLNLKPSFTNEFLLSMFVQGYDCNVWPRDGSGIYTEKMIFFSFMFLAAGIAPKLWKDIKIRKSETMTQRRTADEYGKTLFGPMTSKPSKQDVLQLRQDLLNATQSTGNHVPAVHVLTAKNFGGAVTPVEPVTTLPERASEDDPCILPVKTVEVTAKPTPLSLCVVDLNIPMHTFITTLKTDSHQRREVEKLTRGQNKNIDWFHQRCGALTTTKFRNIMRLINGAKINPCRIVAECFGDKFLSMVQPPQPNIEALKWGCSQEPSAREAYIQNEGRNHSNFRVIETGLILHRTKSYIRASPDGIVLCDCCMPRVLEIKCPYSARNKKVCEEIEYLEERSGDLQLAVDNRFGYYEQVQGCMAVTGTNKCHFVVYTVSDIKVINVSLDAQLWQLMESALDKFYLEYMIPEMYRRQDSHFVCDTTSGVQTCDKDDEMADDELLHAVNSITGASACAVPVATTSTAQSTVTVTTTKKRKPRKPGLVKKKKTPELHLPLVQDKVVCVGPCGQVLPEPDFVAHDNCDASVGCDCPQCAPCDSWSCWRCAGYTQEMADDNDHWFCDRCRSSCNILH